MNLKKRSLVVEFISNNQTFVIAVVACVLIIGAVFISLAVSVTKASPFLHPQTDVVTVSNQQFWEYTTAHHCTRTVYDGNTWWLCENGWWLEYDLIRVIQNRYPN